MPLSLDPLPERLSRWGLIKESWGWFDGCVLNVKLFSADRPFTFLRLVVIALDNSQLTIFADRFQNQVQGLSAEPANY